MKKVFISLLVLISFQSCENQKHQNTKSNDSFATYEILKIEPLETRVKAQLKCYAYLTTDTITEKKLQSTLLSIYFDLTSYNKFENHSEPTMITVYLFTSKDYAMNRTDSWIAMLSRTPNDDYPNINFNKWKLNALQGLNDTIITKDEIALSKLNKYFNERNTDLCSMYNTLYEIEERSIEQADIVFPEYSEAHIEYQKLIYKEEKDKVFSVFNINDSLTTMINVYGMSYCK